MCVESTWTIIRRLGFVYCKFAERMWCRATVSPSSWGAVDSGGEKSVRYVPALTRSRCLNLILITAAYYPVSIHPHCLQSPACPLDFLLIFGCDNNLIVFMNLTSVAAGRHRHVELKVFLYFPLWCSVSNKLWASSVCVLLPGEFAQLLQKQSFFWSPPPLHIL